MGGWIGTCLVIEAFRENVKGAGGEAWGGEVGGREETVFGRGGWVGGWVVELLYT